MSLKERRRAAQDRIIERIAQVGNQPVTGIIHQISAGIIENPLQDCGADEGESDHCPGIVKVCRDESLEIDRVICVRDSKQEDVVRPGRRIQDSIEDRSDQQYTKCVKKTDRRQQYYRRDELPPIRH